MIYDITLIMFACSLIDGNCHLHNLISNIRYTMHNFKCSHTEAVSFGFWMEIRRGVGIDIRIGIEMATLMGIGMMVLKGIVI